MRDKQSRCEWTTRAAYHWGGRESTNARIHSVTASLQQSLLYPFLFLWSLNSSRPVQKAHLSAPPLLPSSSPITFSSVNFCGLCLIFLILNSLLLWFLQCNFPWSFLALPLRIPPFRLHHGADRQARVSHRGREAPQGGSGAYSLLEAMGSVCGRATMGNRFV